MDGLAEAVAAREIEADIDTDQISSEMTDRIAISLHHVHLPKLAEADAVTYDAEANTASLVQAENFAPFMRATGESL